MQIPFLLVFYFQRFLWKEPGEAINYNPQQRPRRQEMDKQYLENGSFLFLLKTKNILIRQSVD